MQKPLLIVKNLKTYFKFSNYMLKAVDGVNFEIYEGESIGLVGESACGKTVTARSILKLVEQPGEIIEGSIVFYGKNLLELDKNEMRKIRGREIAMIFQDPTTALNPTRTIGWQIKYILKHNILNQSKVKKNKSYNEFLRNKAIMLCKEVGIHTPEEIINYYPHQLSGGMVQRVLIALVLGCQPKLIIADEPTTNLDVTIETQILKLFAEMQKKLKTSILYISHDLGVVSELCERVMVMYAGRIVEIVSIMDLLRNAKHPYTKGLISSNPPIDSDLKELPQIEGEVPDLANPPLGCKFSPRCNCAMEICNKVEPKMTKVNEKHFVACHLW